MMPIHQQLWSLEGYVVQPVLLRHWRGVAKNCLVGIINVIA